MSLHTLTVCQLRDKIRTGEVSSREATQSLLNRIASVDGKVKAYNWLNADNALAQADAAKKGGVLAGVPVAIKDVINVDGQPCTCASKILQGYVAPYDATVIRKLREAGAILVGRTNMDEFAMGSSTENSSWGTTCNPWDLTRIPRWFKRWQRRRGRRG